MEVDEKVSIIVPVYNVEKYLNKCLNSIICQTYKNIEIIVVNDGSTDDSYSIMEDWKRKDNRVKIYSKENGGLSDARNFGVKKSSGNYLMFIDSDDYIDNKMVEIMYKDIKLNNSDFCFCNIYYQYDDHKKIAVDIKNQSRTFSGKGKFSFLFDLHKKISVMACNKMYRKSLFDGITYPLNKLNEDEYVIYDLINKSNVISYISKPLYYYYQRGNSIMHKFNSKRFEVFDLLENRTKKFESEKLIEFANKNDIFNYIISVNNLCDYKMSKDYNKDIFNTNYQKMKKLKRKIKHYDQKFLDRNELIKLKLSMISFNLYYLLKRIR